jgi:hypothetical protein
MCLDLCVDMECFNNNYPDKGLETRAVPGTKVLSKRHRGSCTKPTRISQEPTLVAFIAASPVI